MPRPSDGPKFDKFGRFVYTDLLHGVVIKYIPDLDQFERLARQGNLIPVFGEILWDLESPVGVFLRQDPSDYAFLLESVEGGEKWGRYSFLGSEPRVIYKCKGGRAEVIEGASFRAIDGVTNPLEPLRQILKSYQPVQLPGLPRFFGGAVGYLGYDLVRYFEKLPAKNPDLSGSYDVHMFITDKIIIFDRLKQTIKIVVNAHLGPSDDLKQKYEQAVAEIGRIAARLKSPAAIPEPAPQKDPLEFQSNFSKPEFEKAVGKILEYIRAGDIIQAVPSQRFRAPARVDPFQLYRALRHINPSPYLFYLKMGGEVLVGSSPEVLVRVEDGRAETRPIAGTRPRGKTPEQDRELETELKNDPKEMAEHIMLVDLGRNDLGRVCKLGTVRVSELGVIEKYSHVMHLVSNVVGEVEEGRDAFDVLAAAFPAGTLTGAPKIRAMEIIEELEPSRRGVYGGAVGYFSFNGNMDMCITIRTIQIKDGMISIQVGAGIVADSVPANEFQETVNKAKAMMRAVDMARRGLSINGEET
jgi:anthranilate synthase component I